MQLECLPAGLRAHPRQELRALPNRARGMLPQVAGTTVARGQE